MPCAANDGSGWRRCNSDLGLNLRSEGEPLGILAESALVTPASRGSNLGMKTVAPCISRLVFLVLFTIVLGLNEQAFIEI